MGRGLKLESAALYQPHIELTTNFQGCGLILDHSLQFFDVLIILLYLFYIVADVLVFCFNMFYVHKYIGTLGRKTFQTCTSNK